MTLAHCPAPTTAERIRSTCVRAGGALLAVEGAEPLTTPLHHLLADGSFAVAVPVDGLWPRSWPTCDAAGRRPCWSWPTTRRCRCANRCARWCGSAAGCTRCRCRRCTGLLDLIAAEHPNPALLQVQTPDSGTGGRAR